MFFYENKQVYYWMESKVILFKIKHNTSKSYRTGKQATLYYVARFLGAQVLCTLLLSGLQQKNIWAALA